MESPRCIGNGPKYNEICCTGFLNCIIKNLNCAVFREFSIAFQMVLTTEYLPEWTFLEFQFCRN